jgi:hypothetical protein
MCIPQWACTAFDMVALQRPSRVFMRLILLDFLSSRRTGANRAFRGFGSLSGLNGLL